MNEHRLSKNQLPEFTYEQIVEGKRPSVLSGPYIPAYLVRAEIVRLTRELALFKRYYGSSDDMICERNALRAELAEFTSAVVKEALEVKRLRAALATVREIVTAPWAKTTAEGGSPDTALIRIREALGLPSWKTAGETLVAETPLSWFLKQSSEFKEAVYTSAMEKASDEQNAVVRAADETAVGPRPCPVCGGGTHHKENCSLDQK